MTARLLLVISACSITLGASFNVPRDATWTRRGLSLQRTRARMADEFRWRRVQREARMEASSEDEKLSLSSLFNAGAVKQVLIGVAVLVSASGFAEKLPRFLESPSGNLADIAIDAIVFALASSSLAKSFGIIGGVDYSALDNPSPAHCDDTSVQRRGDCRRMQLLCVLLLAWARARAPIPVSDGPSGGSTRLPLARGGERGALPAAVALLFDAPTIRRDPARILQSDLDLVLTALFSVMMMFHFTHLDAIKGLSQSL